MVTLHPAVIYFRDDKHELQHSSYVYVSEVLHHNAAMVISIIDKLIKTVKVLVPDLKYVHFWTDLPSSQYRNKTIFDVISRFAELYGPHASWHYFESGHGKGQCDGVGGTIKRNANNAVKQGKVLIQDAADFYAWAVQSEKCIHYEMITEEEYCHNKSVVDQRNSEIEPDRDKAVRLIFMQECEKIKRKFKWPANEDIDWVKTDEIVKKVNAQAATSRAGRMFPEDVFDLLDERNAQTS